jgi:hypothetical protein
VLWDEGEVGGGGGSAATWTQPQSSYGIVANGDNDTFTGLWLEHFKKTQMTVNGQGDNVIFFEDEPPYTPPNQAAWMQNATARPTGRPRGCGRPLPAGLTDSERGELAVLLSAIERSIRAECLQTPVQVEEHLARTVGTPGPVRSSQ